MDQIRQQHMGQITQKSQITNIFPLIISFYIFVFPFVYVILAVILFCFLFPIRSVRSPLAIGSCFCLFLFSYFEIRFNILASIYVIIIFIDSFCVCINIL